MPRDDAPAQGVVVEDALVVGERLGPRRGARVLGRVVEALASGRAVRPGERVGGVARGELALDGRGFLSGRVVAVDAGLGRAHAPNHGYAVRGRGGRAGV